MPPGCLLLELYQALNEDSGPETGPVVEIISHSWLRKVWGSLRRSWNVWLETGEAWTDLLSLSPL